MKLERYNPIDLFDILTNYELTSISDYHRNLVKDVNIESLFGKWKNSQLYNYDYSLIVYLSKGVVTLCFYKERIHNMDFKWFEKETYSEKLFSYTAYIPRNKADVIIREHNFKELYK